MERNNDIKIGKMYNEYSKEELMALPEPPSRDNPRMPFMWNGYYWEYVMID